MKYLFTILFIFPIITFSQVGSKGTYGTTNGVNGPNFGSMTSDALNKNAENRAYKEQIKNQNLPIFQNLVNEGMKYYYSSDYKSCLSMYENSKGLGWYDSNFEFYAGLAAFQLYVKTKYVDYKNLSKKILKLAKKHGSIDAKIFLKENF
jgi:hypothetical protein